MNTVTPTYKPSIAMGADNPPTCNRRDETPRGLANRELVGWLKLIGRQEVPYPQKETRRAKLQAAMKRYEQDHPEFIR